MAKDFSILPTGTIEAYINSAYQIPVLTLEEERSLAVRLRDQNDMEAAKRLVTSHLRFVIRIARGYLGYGLPLPDLIQEGTVGLMKAVRRFEPDMGVRLVSFAVHWIRAEIHEYILRNWRIVKVATTKAQRKLFFNLRSSKKRLGWLTKQEVDEVAADLGVKPEVVLQMESRLSNQDLSFDGLEDDDDDSPAAPSTYLPDVRMEPSRLLEHEDTDRDQRERLYAALADLDERSKTILFERWLSEKKQTLHELAEKFGVSAERIRQIEKNAMKKVRLQLEV
ncbi:RNA polymerase sigma factor RpoH [Allochromatium vinosum]|uniref:RNA polymerase sigma factor RpoH n=1 Tax=Allochromatium vinosum (strain ATCC 17899 / DSM 180 / NBRC 103801 / NCIMB 10441 / D) TaxID=572477 RepID=D3RP92_ALLVD|nr:RNA polymerase sigma factor RpoH [Allochromatium vinosum]ADC63482.1 RNA polymerase, sigma 32 subunit, RpoH [Allochromatium vinosum DSM 180]MBK1656469.1 RNA polymerase sigma factor RpoH [Allochromatium vinosum]